MSRVGTFVAKIYLKFTVNDQLEQPGAGLLPELRDGVF